MTIVRRVAEAVALPLLILLVWWLYTRDTDSFFLVAPGQLASTFKEVWFSDRLVGDVLPSLVRLTVGLTAAISVGTALGLLIGSVTWLRHLTEPVFQVLRAIPPPVLVPVLMLVIGIGDSMKIFLIAFGAVWPILLNTIEGVRSIEPVQRDTATVYRISGLPRVRWVVLPGALPQIMTGVRQAIPIGLILVVISEMLASTSGLGFTIIQFQKSFAVPEMWSGIFVLGLIGIVLSMGFMLVERRILNWYLGLKESKHA
jgi:ABC-type nitrate/sulfonate/bicarbonate transport system permease component